MIFSFDPKKKKILPLPLFIHLFSVLVTKFTMVAHGCKSKTSISDPGLLKNPTSTEPRISKPKYPKTNPKQNKTQNPKKKKKSMGKIILLSNFTVG